MKRLLIVSLCILQGAWGFDDDLGYYGYETQQENICTVVTLDNLPLRVRLGWSNLIDDMCNDSSSSSSPMHCINVSSVHLARIQSVLSDIKNYGELSFQNEWIGDQEAVEEVIEAARYLQLKNLDEFESLVWQEAQARQEDNYSNYEGGGASGVTFYPSGTGGTVELGQPQ